MERELNDCTAMTWREKERAFNGEEGVCVVWIVACVAWSQQAEMGQDPW